MLFLNTPNFFRVYINTFNINYKFKEFNRFFIKLVLL